MNALLEAKSTERTDSKLMDSKRLHHFITSASRLHAGPLLLNELSHHFAKENEQVIEYWQKETDSILLEWLHGSLSHASSIRRISILKNQLRKSCYEDSTSQQSIDALLSAAWNLVNAVDVQEKTSLKNEAPKLKAYPSIP